MIANGDYHKRFYMLLLLLYVSLCDLNVTLDLPFLVMFPSLRTMIAGSITRVGFQASPRSNVNAGTNMETAWPHMIPAPKLCVFVVAAITVSHQRHHPTLIHGPPTHQHLRSNNANDNVGIEINRRSTHSH